MGMDEALYELQRESLSIIMIYFIKIKIKQFTN